MRSSFFPCFVCEAHAKFIYHRGSRRHPRASCLSLSPSQSVETGLSPLTLDKWRQAYASERPTVNWTRLLGVSVLLFST